MHFRAARPTYVRRRRRRGQPGLRLLRVECSDEPLALQPAGGGPTGTTQYYGKAYPALRELTVARDLGRRSVLGSICSPNTKDDTRADFGYAPVFGAVGQRLAATLLKP